MKAFLAGLIALLLSFAPLSSAFAETVAEFIKRTADARNFSPDILHPEAKVIALGRGMELVFSNQQIAEMSRQGAAAIQGFEISNFEIQQQTTVGDFVSVVYSFEYEVDVGESTVSGALRSLEILEKQGSSYRFVFGVQLE